MTIFICVIFAIVIVVTACGSERLGSHFEVVKRAGHIENISRGEKELGIVGGSDDKIYEIGREVGKDIEFKGRGDK